MSTARTSSRHTAADCNATVLAEVDWIVNDQTVVRPDLAVICEAAPVGHLTSAPAFIVEVLLESTRSRDLSFKQSLYASEGVGWYLTLDASNGKPPSEAAGSQLTLILQTQLRLNVEGTSSASSTSWQTTKSQSLC